MKLKHLISTILVAALATGTLCTVLMAKDKAKLEAQAKISKPRPKKSPWKKSRAARSRK
jgi:hypothetical protein